MKVQFLFALAGLALASQANAGAVIVSGDAAVSSFDKAGVQGVFLGRDQKVGDAPVALVFQRAGTVREKFDADVLGKPGSQLTAHWSRLIFTGRAKQPEEAGNDAEVVAKVAGKPGAIGYVDSVPAGANVKVVFEF